METLRRCQIDTPIGPMVAIAGEGAVCLLEFEDRRMLQTNIKHVSHRVSPTIVEGENAVLEQLRHELTEYFAGDRRVFLTPLRTAGTPFQETVWTALRRIPSGETVSYGELASRIGRPEASRAVARANGDNRIAILIPCHRVIGSDGTLVGYGGGLERKRALLDLEGVHTLFTHTH